MIWLLLLAAAPATGGRVCKPPSPDMQVKVSFKAGASVDDLANFASAILCEPWKVSAAVRKRTLKLSVDGEVSVRQLPALFRLLTDSAVVEGPATARAQPELEPPPPPSATCNPKLVAGIVPVDAWTRKIPLSSKGPLMECAPMQVRVVPAFKNGAAQGFKIFGIKPGSLGAALAFQNGDVVLGVNGSDLSTPQQAMDAYGKLMEARDLKFSILRNNEPRTISWQLR